jgi:hypothetical protein
MKIAGRPRRQKGHLSQRCGSWIGSWRRYDKDGRPTKESSRLGLVLDVSENEARDRLRRIITQIEDSAAITSRISGRGIVELDAPVLDRIAQLAYLGKGTISELLVCVDLISKGLHPFRALDAQACCDLVVVDQSGRTLRVEVKTAGQTQNGKYVCRLGRNIGKFDMAAFVFPRGRIEYRQAYEIKDDLYPLDDAEVSAK